MSALKAAVAALLTQLRNGGSTSFRTNSGMIYYSAVKVILVAY